GFAFRFSSFAFRFSMLRIFRGFGGADRHVRRQFLESLLRNPRHGQQILGALERSALRAKIDDRLRRHWPDPRQLLELLQRRRIQINRMRRQRLLRRHRRAGKHQSAYKDVNQYLQARRSTIPRHTAPTPESFCHFHPLQRHRLGRSFATGRLRLVPSNWDHLTKNRNDSQKRSPTAIAASLSQFDRLDLFDTKVKATAMHRQIRDRRTFFFGPPKNPVFSYSSRGSALRASNWSSSRNCVALSIPYFYVTEKYSLRLRLRAVADDYDLRVRGIEIAARRFENVAGLQRANFLAERFQIIFRQGVQIHTRKLREQAVLRRDAERKNAAQIIYRVGEFPFADRQRAQTVEFVKHFRKRGGNHVVAHRGVHAEVSVMTQRVQCTARAVCVTLLLANIRDQPRIERAAVNCIRENAAPPIGTLPRDRQIAEQNFGLHGPGQMHQMHGASAWAR